MGAKVKVLGFVSPAAKPRDAGQGLVGETEPEGIVPVVRGGGKPKGDK